MRKFGLKELKPRLIIVMEFDDLKLLCGLLTDVRFLAREANRIEVSVSSIFLHKHAQ